MATKRKTEDYASGISVEDGHAQIDDGISELPSQALMKCYTLTEVSLPLSVRIIGDYCFARCSSLKKAKIPNSVEVIGKAAFFYCTNLTDVTIAQDQPRLRVIGDQAFNACRALKGFEAPESVVEIRPKAFHACLDLLNVTIHGQNLTTVREEVFSGCSSLVEAILPSSVKSIEKMAFQGCRKLHTVRQSQGQREPTTSTKGVMFLSSITSVGERSFENCKSLESVVPSETLRIIDFAAFRGCESLEDFEFPEGLEVIEGEAMARCSLLGFARLPTSLVRIGRQAFDSCTTLQSVIMPPSEFSRLESVGQMAFRRCLSLCNLCFPNCAEVQTNALEGCERLHDLLPQNFDFCLGDVSFRTMVGSLTTRFDRLPLLRLCYYQSYYPSEELRGRCSNVEMAGGASKADCCGMRALHLLALSRCSNLDFWKFLMEENPSNIMAMDNRGHLPLGYLLLHYYEPAVLDMYFAAQHKSYPFESTLLDYIIRNTFPYPTVQLRSVLRLSLDRWAENLGWKQAIMDGVDLLCASSTSTERIMKISHLQNILRKYQMKEIFSLLELAIWNSKIQQSTVEENSNDFRQNCRLQCGDEVILRNVLPFLWAPHESSSEEDELMADDDQFIPNFRYDAGQGVRYVEAPPQHFDLMADMFGFASDYYLRGLM